MMLLVNINLENASYYRRHLSITVDHLIIISTSNNRTITPQGISHN